MNDWILGDGAAILNPLCARLAVGVPEVARGFGLLTRGMVWMVEFDEVKLLIGEILQLDERARAFELDTPLLGSIPEFDSMAVLTLIHALEQQFGIQIADDEISAETFETVGRVYQFVRNKVMTAA